MKQELFSVFSMKFPLFIIPVWAVCIFIFSCTSESRSEKNAVHRPNFLIYLSDDHSYQDAGCYGNPVIQTPHIDRFAGEGMRFTHMFTVAAMCAPSRSALLSGSYPFRNGCVQNHGSVRPSLKTLPHHLSAVGYEVVLAGKRHIAPEQAFPFRYLPLEEVETYLTAPHEQPFCLIIASKMPHTPFVPLPPEEAHDPEKVLLGKKMVDTPETRKVVAAYYDNVKRMDTHFGEILAVAAKQAFANNLVTIYTSDHGAGLPFAKWTLYDEGIRVPFIIRWPGVIEAGATQDALVSFTDILPTLMTLAGENSPDSIDGKSFKSLLTRHANQHHTEIFGLHTTLGIENGSDYPIRCVRTQRYKLICNLNPEGTFTNNIIIPRKGKPRPGIEPGFLWSSWEQAAQKNGEAATWTIRYQQRPRFELYDLQHDPEELINQADNPDYQEILKTLEASLHQWMQEQGDTLLYRFNSQGL